MGIQGLLPLLKSIQKPCSLKKFAGETIGVDAYGWLHRGTVSCAMELATGKPTKKYVDFVMHRVRMLQHFGVTPFIVFDGDYLPSKAGTEKEREKRREDSRKLGLELEKAGKISQAYLELQKAVDVTPEMARAFIEELKKAGVQYVVAPYEADAQLVYLERKGLISAILSEDSDLLVFGAKCLLTKLDQYGECIEVNKADFCKCREVSLTGWSDVEFRQMAILSGCDYLPSINGMGLKTAYRMVRKYKSVERVIRMLQFDGKFHVPKGYMEAFGQAELTFLHQWVFCPIQNKLVFHTEPNESLDAGKMPFIGMYVEPKIAQEIACGNLNPITKKPIVIRPINTMTTPRTSWNSKTNVQRAVPTPTDPKKGIENFFKPKRIPLGELCANDFKHSPSQLDVLRRNAGVDWEAMPVPESENSEIARESPPLLLPRNYVHGEDSTSGPAFHTNSPSLPLSRGRSVSSTRAMADPRSPKRARLCADESSDSLPSSSSQTNTGRSRFFASSTIGKASPSVGKAGKSRRSNKKEEFGILSDDSIEEAFANMPDEMLNPQTLKKGKGFEVFKDSNEKAEEQSQSSSCGETTSQVLQSSASTQNSVPSLTQSTSFISTGEAPPTPVDTPTTSFTATAISKFSFTPTPATSKVVARSVFANGLATPPTHTSRIPLPTSSSDMKAATNDKSLSRGIPSALQRLGAKALNSTKLPGTPPFTPRPVPPKSIGQKNGVPFPEVARAKHLEVVSTEAACQIPLPPADKEESAALSIDNIENEIQIGGSEDMIIYDSEEEEELYIERAGKGKLDLTKFAFAG